MGERIYLARLINARGERFMEKHDPERIERGELSNVVAAFAKEIVEGRGPVYVDLRHVDESYWADIARLHRGGSILLTAHVPDPRTTPLPIEPTWGLWACGRSGLQLDLDCRTNVAGLLAAGAAAKNDATGTHASAGSPTAFCKVTGWYAGDTAAREALEAQHPSIAQGVLAHLRHSALEPLSRLSDRQGSDPLHDNLAKLESSVVNSMVLNERRLKDLLAGARETAEAATATKAQDLHDLVKLHEAVNVAQNAEIVYLSALDRTESREQFFREDYPLTDPSWFCWHGVEKTAHGLRFDRQEFPTEGAKFKPEEAETGLGRIGQIMGAT